MQRLKLAHISAEPRQVSHDNCAVVPALNALDGGQQRWALLEREAARDDLGCPPGLSQGDGVRPKGRVQYLLGLTGLLLVRAGGLSPLRLLPGWEELARLRHLSWPR